MYTIQRRINTMKIFSIFLIATGLLLGSGCQIEKNEPIRVSGAWALYPMMQIWADEYQKIQPVKIEVGGGGAGKGMSDVLNGQVDIAMCSRPIRSEELELGAFYIAVTKDAVIAIVNLENPILEEINKQGLSKERLRVIFMKEKTKWGEIAGKDLKDDKIVVYGRSDASGAAKVWAKFLGDYTQSKIQNKADANFSGDQALCNMIKTDKNAIGFCNINYAYNIENGNFAKMIRPVPLDINNNKTLDSKENFYQKRDDLVKNITNEIYPSPPSRLEYVVSKGPFKPKVKKFISWILTVGQKFVIKNGYVKLPDSKLQDEIKYLNEGKRRQ